MSISSAKILPPHPPLPFLSPSTPPSLPSFKQVRERNKDEFILEDTSSFERELVNT